MSAQGLLGCTLADGVADKSEAIPPAGRNSGAASMSSQNAYRNLVRIASSSQSRDASGAGPQQRRRGAYTWTSQLVVEADVHPYRPRSIQGNAPLSREIHTIR